MGVRYNAEKTNLGMYYTTPIYQFRMKCHLCTSHFSIKTDPANMDYAIVEEARRVEQRWDPKQNWQIVPDDKQVGRKLVDDAIYKLEHQTKDKDKSADAAPRFGRIYQIQDSVTDDYLANRVLRDQFRAKKKERKAIQEADKRILRRT
jgi:coiled-coil domain-containing protein 130